MTEESAIIDYLRRFVDINEDEASVFAAAFKKVFIKKRQFIVQPDFPVLNRFYVLKGAFRAYVVTGEGQDHTISFAIDDWWITDYNAYLYQQNATMFVVALEDSAALSLDFEKEQSLKKMNPKFETFFRKIAERGLAYQQRRVISNLTLTAEQRYQAFLSNYPVLAQRVPQYALASFLGMTTEYLSRLRKRRLAKNK
ncbi:Crp/Fnr family transcriptional regulator [Desertivirga brevis]|uniref:Crp/Fnr family transcriptional regulator n=1 Tax=Desertivirga brevis TaxID=2810310 RepID=UPI001A96A946|nr:Crp/Fnr family transcriptional regulator [Pedobacter sp. SYSU D00873]